jgi:hypothetical protein
MKVDTEFELLLQTVSAGVKYAEETILSNMVSGCLSLMIALRNCSQLPEHSVESEAVFLKALQAFQPTQTSNVQIFDRLAEKVILLKSRVHSVE